MATSWAELSKAEKKSQRAQGMTKKSYNKSTGYRALAKDKAQSALNDSNTKQDPNKFPDGSPRSVDKAAAAKSWTPNYDDIYVDNGKTGSQRGQVTLGGDKQNYKFNYDANSSGDFSYSINDKEGNNVNWGDLDNIAKSNLQNQFAKDNSNNSNSGNSGNPNSWPDGTPRSVNTNNGITYDYADSGKGRKFDVKDMQNMRDQGYSDDDISNYVGGLSRDQVGAGAQVKTGAHLPEDVSNLDNYDPMSIGNLRVARGKEQTGADLQKSELKHLMEAGGHSAYELNEWAKANDYSLGNKAQKFLNKQLNMPTTDVTAPPDEEPDINTNPDMPEITTQAMYETGGGHFPIPDSTPIDTTMAVGIGENGADDYIKISDDSIDNSDNSDNSIDNSVGDGISGGDGIVGGDGVVGDDNQYVDGNDNFVSDGDIDDSVLIGGDNNGQIADDGGLAMGDGSSIDANVGNTSGDRIAGDLNIGDGSNFIGNYNPNADYSVTIGNQTFGSDGTPSGTTGLNNMQGAAAYGALNNNAWHTSQAQLSGLTRPAQSSAAANLTTNADARINSYDFNAASEPAVWQQRAKDMTANMFGDTDFYPSFTWNNPTKAEPIKTTY
tara:strand:- start:901 stop:2721 length:1821 start_codon:yes stop_codon:yes gene_type:complete